MPSVQEIHRDIEQTIGHVPAFVKEVPPTALEGMWGLMKNFEMAEETTIPPKYRELIGLAVASAIPCNYCVHWHKEGARMNGASDQEIREAIMQASTTRMGSALVNGVQQEFDEFKDEVREMTRYVQSKKQAGAPKRGPSPAR